ncbi:MAG TPA: hypothetical protein VFG81_10435 [Anaerolineales bacterium]|jgi:hypothetical protein|nr:hypothetical protein [Anaerolineales bacterium]
MDDREEIDQYDLVEIIQVPQKLEGVIDLGDVGVVVEKYDEENLQVECLQPGGATKWLERVHVRYLRLRSKDPYNPWIEKSLTGEPIMRRSVLLGVWVGALFGGLIGAAFGAITRTFNGILVGLVIGLGLGIATGALTAALTVKTAGTTGGIGVGYFTGLVFGGMLGILFGALTPTSLRMSVRAEGSLVLDALMSGRFETAMFIGFLLSVLGAMVGTWVAGKNLIPRNLKERYRP